nr:hypothetical protein [Verrucomicrobiota bacterium]
APFAKVTILKDSEPVHVVEPQSAEVDFSWTDPKPVSGKTSYYDVRGEQADGELVWASPMWIAYEGKQAVTLASRNTGAALGFALLLTPLGIVLVKRRRR